MLFVTRIVDVSFFITSFSINTFSSFFSAIRISACLIILSVSFGIDFSDEASSDDTTFKSKSPSETLSPTLTSIVSIFTDIVDWI